MILSIVTNVGNLYTIAPYAAVREKDSDAHIAVE